MWSYRVHKSCHYEVIVLKNCAFQMTSSINDYSVQVNQEENDLLDDDDIEVS